MQLQGLQIAGHDVPMKLVAQDMGCDLSYCRRITKAVANKRLNKVKRVLGRIAQRKLPRKFKAAMATQLSFSVIGYGSELAYHTPKDLKHLRHLRSACCKALGRTRSGANPHLSLMTPGDGCDPHNCGYSYVRSSSGVACLTSLHISDRLLSFLDRLAAPCAKSNNGPASVLRKAFRDMGWECVPNGVVRHVQGWHCDWLRRSKRFISHVLTASWNRNVCAVASKRKHFDIQSVDLRGIRQAMKPMNDQQRLSVSNLRIGRRVANDALVHYSTGPATPNCTLCDEKDSRSFQIQSCPHCHSDLMSS